MSILSLKFPPIILSQLDAIAMEIQSLNFSHKAPYICPFCWKIHWHQSINRWGRLKKLHPSLQAKVQFDFILKVACCHLTSSQILCLFFFFGCFFFHGSMSVRCQPIISLSNLFGKQESKFSAGQIPRRRLGQDSELGLTWSIGLRMLIELVRWSRTERLIWTQPLIV